METFFRVTDPLLGESQWIPLTKADDTGLWWLVSCVPEQTAEQTIETLAVWDATTFIMTSL